MATLKVSRRGYVTQVDDEDLERMADYRWSAGVGRGKRVVVTGHPKRRGLNLPPIYTPSKGVSLSRFLMNCPADKEVDHINGDPLDNRKANLRIVTRAENMQNRRVFVNSKTGYKGVTREKDGRYRATIRMLYDDPVAAARMYDMWAAAAFGDYALLNFPSGTIAPDKAARAAAARITVPDESEIA